MTPWYGYTFPIAVSVVGIRLSYVSFHQTVPMMRCFDVSMNNLLNKQYCPVIWNVMTLIWRLCDTTLLHVFHWSEIRSNNIAVHQVNR